MRITAYYLLLAVLLASCAPTPPEPASYSYFAYQLNSNTLVNLTTHQPTSLDIPSDCSFANFYPAPRAHYLAIELNCASNSLVLMWDTSTSKYSTLLPNGAHDSHFLAWDRTSRSLYLKTNSLTAPKIFLYDVSNNTSVEQNIPNTVYHMDVAADGSVLYALTRGLGFGSEVYINNHLALSDAKNIITFATFSPDAKHIAYITLPDSQTPFPLGGLWVADADGTNAHRLADADAGRGFAPSWSPDSTRIAFVARENPNDESADQNFDSLKSNIYIANISNNKAIALTEFQNTFVMSPRWSPDGATITFNIASDATIQAWQVNVATHVTQALDAGCCAFWLPNE